MTTVLVAAIQDAPVAFDIQGTLNKIKHLVAEAAEKGAKLVVFPEAFISGYPKGADFGARVGMRSTEGRQEFLNYFNGAIVVPGPETQVLTHLASQYQIYIVMGILEREGGTIYCSALIISPEDGLVGNHRKVMPTAMERLIWGFGDGSTLKVIPTKLGRIGTVICWENYMPLLRATMYSQNIQLYCAPTVDDRDTWLPAMQTIAIEGRCFVISAVQFARRSDFPADYSCIQGNDPETILIHGGSCIVDPFGHVLAGPVRDQACILTSDLDIDEIIRGKYDLDATGHYARPDIFKLLVNTAPQKVVTLGGDFGLTSDSMGDLP
jgi:nitrilase